MARSSDSSFLVSLLRDKTFQAREIRRVIKLATCYLVITTILLGVFYHQMLGNLLNGVAPLLFVSEDIALVNDAIPSLTAVIGRWLIAMMIVNVVVTIAVGMYITRRLGHPLLAIKRSLREIGNGNLDVRLRAADEEDFGEIAIELMAAMQTVREQVGAAKQQIATADQLIGQPETRAEDIEAALKNCKIALDHFQVDSDPDADDDVTTRAA